MGSVERFALVAEAVGGAAEAMRVLKVVEQLAGLVAWVELPAEYVNAVEQARLDLLMRHDLVELLVRGSDGRSAPHYAFTEKGRALVRELVKR